MPERFQAGASFGTNNPLAQAVPWHKQSSDTSDGWYAALHTTHRTL